MKLIFQINLNDDLEKNLAMARYSKFWGYNKEEILDSFYKHTGLKFKQKQITVRIRSDGRSRAGNKFQPMELSAQWVLEANVGCTLIHELAHRLVIGNGIEPVEGNKFIDTHTNYYMHKHIYLFLYDVYRDVLGNKVAQEEVNRESTNPKLFYAKAWNWALSMNYEERQMVFKRLKRRYVVSRIKHD